MSLNLKLEIRRNIDNAVVEDIKPNWAWNEYWFKEGNAACDCNRELFFARAEKGIEPVETACGTNRYSVRCSDADTGAVLYQEF